MKRPSLASAVPLLVLLAACASSADQKMPGEPAVPATAETKPTEPVKVTTGDPQLDKRARLAQDLLDMDQRIDRYAALASQPGDEARAERGVLERALNAKTLEHRKELLELAGNANDPQPRRTAVKALAFSGDHAAVPVLVAALSQKDDARLVTSATYALARLGDPSTPTDPLLALVRDPDSNIRSNALLALGRIFDARVKAGGSALDPIDAQKAMPVFEVALFDAADPLVRANSAAALGALGDKRAVDPLLNLLRDEHPLVRTKTALALGKLGDLKAVAALVKTIDVTPPGTPKGAVILALTMILERHGAKVPPNMGDSGRVWENYVREVMAAAPPK